MMYLQVVQRKRQPPQYTTHIQATCFMYTGMGDLFVQQPLCLVAWLSIFIKSWGNPHKTYICTWFSYEEKSKRGGGSILINLFDCQLKQAPQQFLWPRNTVLVTVLTCNCSRKLINRKHLCLHCPNINWCIKTMSTEGLEFNQREPNPDQWFLWMAKSTTSGCILYRLLKFAKLRK